MIQIFRWPLLGLVLFSLMCVKTVAAASAPASKPDVRNVVLIYIDDLGYGDIGAFGCEDIPTPHIDRLAEEGTLCTASHITNPPCCPSRCSLIMGQYAQRFGKYGMSRGLPIPEDRPTLAGFLKDQGYATGQIGKWDIGTKKQGPLQVGFTEVRKNPPRKKYSEDELAEADVALRRQITRQNGSSKYFCLNEQGDESWLTDYDGDSMVQFVQRHKSEPFFLYWSPEAVHSSNNEVPDRLMDRTTAKGKRRKLAGAIVSVDDQVGKLVAALERHDLRKNTLVIFSSDNGANPGEAGSSAPFAGGKGPGTQKEGWVRVPTIVSLPGIVPEGKTYDPLIANFDFYSTITQFCCNTIPEHCDGADLLAHFQNDDKQPHEYLFWLNNEPGDAPRRHLVAVRWQNWRLYRKYESDSWQLFDLEADPKETQNVAADHPELVQQMAAKHSEWKQSLAPLEQIPKVQSASPVIPPGHGWAKAKPAT